MKQSKTTEKLFPFMSNLQTYYRLKLVSKRWTNLQEASELILGYLIKISLKFFSWLNWQKFSIGLNYDLVPNRQQSLPGLIMPPLIYLSITRPQWFNTLRPRQDGNIFQTTVSNAFSLMKIHEFRLIFHWCLFSRVQLTTLHHCFT